MEIGAAIRFYRNRKDMTQQELADELGVSFQSVSYWERDEYQPQMEKIDKLAEALDISIIDLFSELPVDGSHWTMKDQMFSETNMYKRIRIWAVTAGKPQTVKALPYADKMHKGAKRKAKPGTTPTVPYIYHPLLMACHALALGLTDDDLIAAILLHDVVEDCKDENGNPIRPEDLPVGEAAQEAVRLLSKPDKKHRTAENWEDIYYEGIRKNKLAVIVKVLDRCNNVSLMAGGFSKKRMAEYIRETDKYLPALLDEMKASDEINVNNAAFLVKYQILSTIENLKRLLIE